MAGDFGFLHYLWNQPRLVGDLLERVHGEVGLDHLTVPVVTGELTGFGITGGFNPPYFHTEGGWHFAPQAALYEATGLRPRPARWLASRDVLGDLRDQVARLGLRLILRVHLSAVRQILDQSPELAVHGAWGERRTSYAPCPCQPGFRELLRATLRDAVRYAPDGLEIEGVRVEPCSPNDGGEPDRLFPIEPWLGLCFCPACRQIATAAGLDADAIAGLVRARTESLAAASPEERAARHPGRAASEPEVAAFRAARAADLRHWLDGLAESFADREMILIRPDEAPRPTATGDDAPVGGAWTVAARAEVATMLVPRAVDVLRERFVHSGRHGLALPLSALHPLAASEFVRFVAQATEAGVTFFDFEDLAAAPAEVVTWLKQAVRYARRG
ncbi:MAG: hypothetical protein PVJ57_10250 [Phycisphaerae bacterium]|jgi:hypothetical protein